MPPPTPRCYTWCYVQQQAAGTLKPHLWRCWPSPRPSATASPCCRQDAGVAEHQGGRAGDDARGMRTHKAAALPHVREQPPCRPLQTKAGGSLELGAEGRRLAGRVHGGLGGKRGCGVKPACVVGRGGAEHSAAHISVARHAAWATHAASACGALLSPPPLYLAQSPPPCIARRPGCCRAMPRLAGLQPEHGGSSRGGRGGVAVRDAVQGTCRGCANTPRWAAQRTRGEQ